MNAPFASIIDRFSGARILVAGDAMLDIYTSGSSTRQAPEAPVPVINIEDRIIVPGGAANVAANIAALGAQVNFLCVSGNDPARDILMALGAQYGLSPDGYIADDTRPTITKERVSVNGAMLARIDTEKTHDLDGAAAQRFLKQYGQALANTDLVILSDYCKGALPDTMVRHMIAQASAKKIPVLIDSKKKDFSVFAGALCAKPNLKELSERAGVTISGETDVAAAARIVIEKSGIDALLASRSEEGVMLVTKEEVHTYPATARHVGEVSGAGDTLLSACGVALASGATLADAAAIGNIAAGLAVEKSGTSIVSKEELRDAVLRCSQERQSA